MPIAEPICSNQGCEFDAFDACEHCEDPLCLECAALDPICDACKHLFDDDHDDDDDGG